MRVDEARAEELPVGHERHLALCELPPAPAQHVLYGAARSGGQPCALAAPWATRARRVVALLLVVIVLCGRGLLPRHERLEVLDEADDAARADAEQAVRDDGELSLGLGRDEGADEDAAVLPLGEVAECRRRVHAGRRGAGGG